MSGLSLEYSTTGINNRSVSIAFQSNDTIHLNCTTIECFDRAPRVIESPWFIGIIVSVIVLIIVFAIVCGIMRRKGGKYSVQDKEMLHGPSGYGDSDGKFSEYYRAPSDASMKHSRASLQNGDDRDSMAEFNDEKDRSRFTEDGSFIGQYGRDDKRHTYLVKYDESDGFAN
ncbi:unnamed protein product [Rotaria magnacalcarata]|uniref:Neurofascin/L1/NrCAM C-terminal domain-containing protein n=1 Tax=Rotaria magnacalcarata TaxID=392030 RepID=A0A816MMH3_9BILA|nr:unnamed protein product [Rotaria magnacalcarata]CAF2134113.1 unnamed protein product [Rotaria magnacalcarata]CAF2149535.1 unnamed protein product [Rotaria magnacalcarata]